MKLRDLSALRAGARRVNYKITPGSFSFILLRAIQQKTPNQKKKASLFIIPDYPGEVCNKPRISLRRDLFQKLTLEIEVTEVTRKSCQSVFELPPQQRAGRAVSEYYANAGAEAGLGLQQLPVARRQAARRAWHSAPLLPRNRDLPLKLRRTQLFPPESAPRRHKRGSRYEKCRMERA